MQSVARKLRIGVNALYLIPGGVGGTEVYLRNLLQALAEIDAENDYFVFTNRETARDLVPANRNFHWMPQAVAASSRPARILWEQTILPMRVAGLGLDVLLNPGYTSPLLCPCPTVTVFHDLQHLRHPEYFGFAELLALRLLLWISVHRSRKLIAVSETTRRDLVKFYGIEDRRVETILHGVNPAFFELEHIDSDPFLLCVAANRKHKNLGRLIRAFAAFRGDQRLIIAGLRGPDSESLEKLIQELGLTESVELTGWIPEERLLDYYGRAHAVVYPSMFEGFGMPVLEALACGLPTACSDISPLREVGGDAVLYFDPLDEVALARALDRICNDAELRGRLSREGRLRARQFTWQNAAKATLAVLKS
ncbi:MAG: glycosyltransferase family 1 protein [Acidobacteriota bacterium]